MRRPPAELLRKARVARLRDRVHLGEDGVCAGELSLNLGRARTAARSVRRQARDARPTDGLLQQVNPCSGYGDGWHDGNTEDLTELADIDATAAFIEFIHQIQHEYHRATKLGELQGEQQGATEILRVGHLYNRGFQIGRAP